MQNRNYHKFLSVDDPSAGIKALGMAAFLVVVFAPLAALAVQLMLKMPEVQGGWFGLMIPAGRRLALFIRSVGLASGVAVFTSITGVIIATVLIHWNSGRAARWRWLVMVTALLPPYIHLMAWEAFLLRLADWMPLFNIGGWLASWWVQSMAFLPLAVGLALLSLESVDRELIQMALTMQDESRVLTQVALPMAMPAILAGAGLIFVVSITDYAIPALYGLQVYSLEIFADFSASNEPGRALALAMPILASTMLVIIAAQSLFRNLASASNSTPAGRWSPAAVWKGWIGGLQILALVILTLQIIVPLAELLIKAGSWHSFVLAINMAWNELTYTLLVAFLAASFSIPLALAPALELHESRGQSRAWWLLTTAPLAVPASLVGIGLVTVWNEPWLPVVYGSVFMPILAALARFTPIAVIIAFAQRRRLDRTMLEAGRVMQPNPLWGFFQIQLPLMKPGLIAASLVVFVLTMGELGATLLVAPPGKATLTMRVFNLMHYGASSSVAGVCLLLVFGGIVAGIFAVMLMGKPGYIREKE